MLSQPDFLLAVARSQSDDIQTSASRRLQDPLGHGVERHVCSERRRIPRLIREPVPVQGALVIQVGVGLLERSPSAAEHLEEIGEHADRVVPGGDPAVRGRTKIRLRRVLPGEHAGLEAKLFDGQKAQQRRLSRRVGGGFKVLDGVYRQARHIRELRLSPARRSAAPPDGRREVLRFLSIYGDVRGGHLAWVLPADVAQGRLNGRLVLQEGLVGARLLT